MKVLIKIYDRSKYDPERDIGKIILHEYNGVTSFEVVSGSSVDLSGMGELDEHDEYLIIYFEDGDTATFRNSRVDLFGLY